MSVYFKTVVAILIVSWVVGRIFHLIISRSMHRGKILDFNSMVASRAEKVIISSFFDWEIVFHPLKEKLLVPEHIKSDAWAAFYHSSLIISEHLLASEQRRLYLSLSFFNQLLNALIPWLFLIVALSYSEFGNKTFPNGVLILFAANVLLSIIRLAYLRKILPTSTIESLNLPTSTWILLSSPFFLSGKSLGDVFEKVLNLFRRP